jgi:AcrR family transcriptional regulator
MIIHQPYEWTGKIMPESTEERLLYAATLVFSDKGFRDSSVDDIVAEARASKSTFYKHFPNKENALLAVFQRFAWLVVDRVKQGMAQAEKKSLQMYAGVYAYVEACFEFRKLTRLLLIDAVGVSLPLENARREAHEYFASLFYQELQMEGGRRIEKDESEIVSRAMVGAINEVVLSALNKEENPDIERIATILSTILTRYLKQGKTNRAGG